MSIPGLGKACRTSAPVGKPDLFLAITAAFRYNGGKEIKEEETEREGFR